MLGFKQPCQEALISYLNVLYEIKSRHLIPLLSIVS